MSQGSPDSGPRMEVSVDHATRMVNIKMWRALDLAPTPIAFPFAVFKQVASEILSDEVDRERHGFRWTAPAGLKLVSDSAT